MTLARGIVSEGQKRKKLTKKIGLGTGRLKKIKTNKLCREQQRNLNQRSQPCGVKLRLKLEVNTRCIQVHIATPMQPSGTRKWEEAGGNGLSGWATTLAQGEVEEC